MATKTIKINYIDSDEIIEFVVDSTLDVNTFCNNMRDGQYNKSLGYRVFDSKAKMQKLIDWIAPRQISDSGDKPATERQIAYLITLKVKLEPGLTMKRASQLIDAARGGFLGSVNGWYTDGSN